MKELSELDRAARLVEVKGRLVPLHKRLGPPRKGDWLAEHSETGQTFEEYVRSKPVTLTGERRVLYVAPLGDFSPDARRIVEIAIEYLRAFFGVEVKETEPLPLSVIPASARRTHPTWGVRQILSTYVLYDVLTPRLPNDAAALIALTSHDLWPGEGWNFVFGQASLRERVGVWSIARYGDPKTEEALVVLRTIKVAAHETGHMFGMLHCTAFECAMCGSNHLDEADRQPSWLCPECLAKLAWATRSEPRAHIERVLGFAKKHGLASEIAFYEEELRRIHGAP